MADGFTHEYEASSSEEEVTQAAPSRLKFPRNARQAAGTAKGLEALARRRAEATERKVAAKASAGAGGTHSSPGPAAPPPAPAAPQSTPPAADESAPAAAPPAPARGRPPKAGAGASAAPAQINPYAHAAGVTPSFDPLVMARLAQMEIELEKMRRRKIGWSGGKKIGKRSKVVEEDDEEEDEEEERGSEEEDEDLEEEAPKRKRARKSPAPKKKPAAVAASEPKVDFFDALMSSQFGRR